MEQTIYLMENKLNKAFIIITQIWPGKLETGTGCIQYYSIFSGKYYTNTNTNTKYKNVYLEPFELTLKH